MRPWEIWRFTPPPRPPKPAGVPALIPAWAWELNKWIEWRRNGGIPADRPEGIPARIPTWAWEVLKAVNAAHPLKPPPPGPEPTPPGMGGYKLWDTVGVKVGDPGSGYWEDWRIRQHLTKLKLYDAAYVLVQTFNDGDVVPEDRVLAWKAICAEVGLAFGIWGCTYTNPVGDARRFAEHIRRFAPAGAAINAEWFYMGNPQLGGDELIRWERNLQFLSTFAGEYLGEKPPALALNTLGAASGNNTFWMPHQMWMGSGFDVHCQAYFNAYDEYHPKLCQDHWSRAGWPLTRVTLTLGCYQPEASAPKQFHYHVDDYLPLLKDCCTVGVNLFMSESLDDVRDLQKIPLLISTGRAARPS